MWHGPHDKPEIGEVVYQLGSVRERWESSPGGTVTTQIVSALALSTSDIPGLSVSTRADAIILSQNCNPPKCDRESRVSGMVPFREVSGTGREEL
jgi:S1-C subfamily serine protease